MSAADTGFSAQPDRLSGDLAKLAGLVEDDMPGWSRRVFSEPYRAEREWIAGLMRNADLETSIDPAGNVIGILRGKNSNLPPLMTGSHTDTVSGGGRFDGIVGVLGAIEAARRLRETNTALNRDLIVVDFLGEEANDFGISCIGSRSIAGLLTADHLDRRSPETGRSLGETMAAFGLDPNAAISQGWNAGGLHGYVELHVEQGPLLERQGKKVGVVTAIAGIERLLATFIGRPDHSGTTPMSSRQDALLAAAEGVLTIEREACGAPIHGVSTTGNIAASPGSFNIVPNSARIWAEMRSVDSDWLHGAKRRLASDIAEAAARRGVETAIEWLSDQDPVVAARSVQDRIAEAAEKLGVDWEAVPSGAGHDAAHLAGLGPMGMIFIPSVGGRSHVPEEFTEISDIALGVDVLTSTLVQMDTAVLSPAN